MLDAKLPKEGEIWLNNKKATRIVRVVNEEQEYVIYERPNARTKSVFDTTVTMKTWLEWVCNTDAKCMRKAAKLIDKDWSYMTK